MRGWIPVGSQPKCVVNSCMGTFGVDLSSTEFCVVPCTWSFWSSFTVNCELFEGLLLSLESNNSVFLSLSSGMSRVSSDSHFLLMYGLQAKLFI